MIAILLFALGASARPLFALAGNATPTNCTAFGDDCAHCTIAAGCSFCVESKTCLASSAFASCNSTLCTGLECGYVCQEPCTADSGRYPCADNIFGQLLLMLFYGSILGGSAKLISDGSELLLELFPAWGTVIGALLLPILGAVPDSAIILVSGLGDISLAQTNIAVGVGTLAGSTIMLLTLAWSGAAALGRCDFNEFGEAIDGVCGSLSLRHQGVTVDEDTPINAKIMLATSLLYFIVQIPSFMHLADPNSDAAINAEHVPSYVGFSACLVALIAYCIYQILVPKLAQKRIDAANAKVAEKSRQIKALSIMNKFPAFSTVGDLPVAGLAQAHVEARALAIGKKWRRMALADAAKAEETAALLPKGGINSDHDEESDSEHEENPRDHFWKNLGKSFLLMAIGTGLVAVFSDPMVDVITKFGQTAHIKPFFVSFVITPFCSNASELLSSLIFASKKKMENASMTYSQLYGAATMNNTLCLGIFFALVAFLRLSWTFSAETTAIVVVTWCVGVPAAFKRNFSLIWAFPIVLCYPLSLALVSLLESPSIGWQ